MHIYFSVELLKMIIKNEQEAFFLLNDKVNLSGTETERCSKHSLNSVYNKRILLSYWLDYLNSSLFRTSSLCTI